MHRARTARSLLCLSQSSSQETKGFIELDLLRWRMIAARRFGSTSGKNYISVFLVVPAV